jgi:hypothetical protein
MKTVIGSNEILDLDDDEVDMGEDPDMVLLCPQCKKYRQVWGDPYGSYGSFQIACRGHPDDCDYMGIELGSRIQPEDRPAGDIESGIDISKFKFWYNCEILLFTEYNKMEDYHYDSDEFKELEAKWLSGNTVWTKFNPPRYYLKESECYNQTLLTEDGEFHFGYD